MRKLALLRVFCCLMLQLPAFASDHDKDGLPDEFEQELANPNPNMRVTRTESRGQVDGQPSLAMDISNDTAAGGREADRLVTVLRPNGLLYYFIGVAPDRDFNRYEPAFRDMIASVRFND